jgi:putative glutamine amidotransferase
MLEYLSRIDGLLLSGGADIHPAVYGEKELNDTVKVDLLRDEAEIPLTREAVRRDLPVLGICRGIQTLNVALGGSLVQDIPSQRSTPIEHKQGGGRSERTHEIEIGPCSYLDASLGAHRLMVNSLHHQAVDRVAPELRVSALAPDGMIEGLEAPGARFIVAVQFHPEEMTSDSAEARRLFESFVAAASASE